MIEYSLEQNSIKVINSKNLDLVKHIEFYKGSYRIFQNKTNKEDLIHLKKKKLSINLETVKQTDSELILLDKTNNILISFDFNLTIALTNAKTNVEFFKEFFSPKETQIIKYERDFSLSELEGHKKEEEYYSFKTQINIKLDEQDAIYGLGDKASFLDKRGYEYIQYNADDPSQHNESYKSLYKSINFVLIGSKLSSLNKDYYGLLYLSTYKSIFNLGCYSQKFMYIASELGEYDYYVILGPTPEKVLFNHNNMYEKTYIPPLKMLGYHQSRWSYKNEEEVREVFNKYIDNDLPIDFINLDIDYMIKYKVYTVDENKFSNMIQLSKDLNKSDVYLIPIIDPAVKKEEGYFFYDYLKDNNLFAKRKNEITKQDEDYVNVVWPGDSCYPNYFDVNTQNYVTKISKEFLLKYNFFGIWTDMNEPASFNGLLEPDIKFYSSKSKSIRYQDEIHNLYATYMVKSIAQAFIQLNRRPCLITRAAYDDTHIFSTTWNGDNQSLFSHLHASLPQIMSMNLSNYVFNGVDIGGFGNNCTKELLIRWIQANVFSPFFRNHSTINSRFQEPYNFDEETLKVYRKYLKLHYKFIPYIYQLVVENRNNGSPVISPLFYYYPDDDNTKTINDQYMLSSKIIVCPIVNQGQYFRSVYLPKGTWYNFFTKEKYKGGKFYTFSINLDELLIFIKDDALIPVLKDGINHISLNRKKEIQFIVMPKAKMFKLYEDDFISNDYMDAKYNLYTIKYDKQNDKLSSSIKSKIDLKDGYDIDLINFIKFN